MGSVAVLEAQAYRAVFEIEKSNHSPHYADVTIEIFIGSRGARLARSSPTFVMAKDLLRLIEYLAAHIDALQAEPSHVSQVFVPLELGFQVQALGGEVESPLEGVFDLRMMLRIPVEGEDSSHVHVGCEGSVEVSKLRAFMRSLETSMEVLQLAV